MILDRQRLIGILDRFPSLEIGVLGDFTLDAYWFADMLRAEISRETPLFARPVVRETYSPGGAGNVAWNLVDLGVRQVHAFTAFGEDWRGEVFTNILHRMGINTESCVRLAEWTTPLFGKVVLMNQDLAQEDARLDFVNTAALPRSSEELLFAQFFSKLPQLQAVIVADYQDCGIFNKQLREKVNDTARQNPQLHWLVDSRKHIGGFSEMLLKPNALEASHMLFPGKEAHTVPEAEITDGLFAYHLKTGNPICLTRGDRGCVLFDHSSMVEIPAVKLFPPVDQVGAGDTFIASMAASLAAGAEGWEAATIATLAAAVTVKVLHATGTASPQQILDQFDQLQKNQ